MADIRLLQESRAIIREMGIVQKEVSLVCPILKVLQMRHHNLDTTQAIEMVRKALDD